MYSAGENLLEVQVQPQKVGPARRPTSCPAPASKPAPWPGPSRVLICLLSPFHIGAELLWGWTGNHSRPGAPGTAGPPWRSYSGSGAEGRSGIVLIDGREVLGVGIEGQGVLRMEYLNAPQVRTTLSNWSMTPMILTIFTAEIAMAITTPFWHRSVRFFTVPALPLPGSRRPLRVAYFKQS